MSLNLKQLEAFVWVADLGSFRKAADRLNTTQPNISARISSLESAMNISLMERDAGSVRLTSKGHELLAHARAVLHAMDKLVVAADEKSLIDGTLRLGVTELVVNTWLRDFLKALKEQLPSLSVELTVDNSLNLTKELSSRSLDLAFQNGPFERPTTGNEDLGKYPTIWVASPTLGLPSKRLGIDQLLQHPIIIHSRGTKSFDDVAAHFDRHVASNGKLVPTSNIAPCLHMTIEGMGVAALPAAMIRDELSSGGLVELNYAWVPEPLHFFARYDADKSLNFVGQAAELARKVATDYADHSPSNNKK
ncbi:MAG: LysR family transcriptional regulator [Hyphomicrobiaceae bacterium]